jgi:sugar phosphate isomerase/epimerase
VKFSFSTKGWHESTFEEFCQVADDLRFEGIELHNIYNRLFTDKDGAFHDYTAAATVRRLYERKLTLPCIDAICELKVTEEAENEIRRLCDQLDVAALLGASVLRHDVCYKLTREGNGRSFDLMLPTIAENIRRVADYAATLGISTCSENHGYIAQDSDRVERLFNTVARDNYGILLDMGNFACVDEDSISATSRLAPYAIHVHAKDFVKHPFSEHFTGGFETRACNRLEGCAIGEGDIPVAQCLAILRRAGYDGFLSIEYEGAEDPYLGIARGRDYLLSLGAEL